MQNEYYTLLTESKGWLANGAILRCDTCGLYMLMSRWLQAHEFANRHNVTEDRQTKRGHKVTLQSRQFVLTANDYIYDDGSVDQGDAS